MININTHSKGFISRSLAGQVWGDYVVTGTRGTSQSRHYLWNCRCRKCGYEKKTERYEIIKNRCSSKCPVCGGRKK